MASDDRREQGLAQIKVRVSGTGQYLPDRAHGTAVRPEHPGAASTVCKDVFVSSDRFALPNRAGQGATVLAGVDDARSRGIAGPVPGSETQTPPEPRPGAGAGASLTGIRGQCMILQSAERRRSGGVRFSNVS
jgi:hypothetical protein